MAWRMNEKQDISSARTPTDLERKYDFDKRFAEVFGIATDAREAAEEAQKSVDGLTQEQIFNILTNNGEEQGIYRKEGKVYINASYIKSGKIAADYIDVGSLEVDAAQIKTGTIDSAMIPELSADKITSGTIRSNLIDGSKLNITEGATIAGWNVGATSLTAGSFGTRGFIGLYTSYPTDENYRLVIGSKFKVNRDGELTATGGKIGGWTIGDSSLSVNTIFGTVTLNNLGITGPYYDENGNQYTGTISWIRILTSAYGGKI